MCGLRIGWFAAERRDPRPVLYYLQESVSPGVAVSPRSARPQVIKAALEIQKIKTHEEYTYHSSFSFLVLISTSKIIYLFVCCPPPLECKLLEKGCSACVCLYCFVPIKGGMSEWMIQLRNFFLLDPDAASASSSMCTSGSHDQSELTF